MSKLQCKIYGYAIVHATLPVMRTPSKVSSLKISFFLSAAFKSFLALTSFSQSSSHLRKVSLSHYYELVNVVMIHAIIQTFNLKSFAHL